MKLKFNVTAQNIKLRFDAEKEEFRGQKMKGFCKKFGISRNLAHRWMTDKDYKQLPNNQMKCPGCGKSMLDFVYDWLNDGTIN